MTPDERAARCAEMMWRDDKASKEIGIVLQSVSAGSAICSLNVSERHTNGHKICHGGITFTLADTAFAVACNSYNQFAVAQNNAISYLAPARLGDTLTATAIEVSRAKRSGVYDVRVCNQHDELLALFRGQCRTINGNFFDESL